MKELYQFNKTILLGALAPKIWPINEKIVSENQELRQQRSKSQK